MNRRSLPVLCWLVVWGMSLGWHITHRDRHYQECDSGLVYGSLYEWPALALKYSAITYPVSGEPSASGSFISNPASRRLAKSLYNQWTRVRLRYINIATRVPMPRVVHSALALAWTSTYSPGVGLLYGMFSTATMSYGDFMSAALTLTIVAFHVGVLFFMLAARRLIGSAEDPLAGLLPATLMLCSISVYSYGYHLGSTVWNVTSASLWLFVLVKSLHLDHETLLRRLSATTGILICFNYLIVFYWAAAVGAVVLLRSVSWPLRWETVRSAIRLVLQTQRAALILIFICVVFFLQPGQGNRANVDSISVLESGYYITLNLFSLDNTSGAFDVVQFLFFFLVCAASAGACIAGARKGQVFDAFIICLLAVYAVATAIGVLAWAPSRHVLFLAPAVFLMCASLLRHVRVPGWVSLVLTAGVLVVSARALPWRSAQVENRAVVPWSRLGAEPIDEILVYDSCNLLYDPELWKGGIPVSSAIWRDLVPGRRYLYVSQTFPLESAKASEQWANRLGKSDLEHAEIAEITPVVAFAGNRRFLAYHPVWYAHDRPNNFWVSVFVAK